MIYEKKRRRKNPTQAFEESLLHAYPSVGTIFHAIISYWAVVRSGPTTIAGPVIQRTHYRSAKDTRNAIDRTVRARWHIDRRVVTHLR